MGITWAKSRKASFCSGCLDSKQYSSELFLAYKSQKKDKDYMNEKLLVNIETTKKICFIILFYPA